jgi:hypothetical protein
MSIIDYSIISLKYDTFQLKQVLSNYESKLAYCIIFYDIMKCYLVILTKVRIAWAI